MPGRALRRLSTLLAFVAALESCRGSGSPPPTPTSGAAATPSPSAPAPASPPPAPDLRLPQKSGSVRFAVIGDSGRGNEPQYAVARLMSAYRERFGFEFVLMLGDNVYDGGSARDYREKFELPYKALLDAGVKFHAAIGNHDDRNQRYYPLFNTRGERYYTFSRSAGPLRPLLGTKVRFFAIDSVELDRAQLDWLDRELADPDADWKICFQHHPLYTSGRYQFAAQRLRRLLEPLFRSHGVQVVFAGHEHFYERTLPQLGIQYFISGGAGSLRRGDIRPSRILARGFDDDYHFMLVEVTGDELYFQAVSRAGNVVDWGIVERARTTTPGLRAPGTVPQSRSLGPSPGTPAPNP